MLQLTAPEPSGSPRDCGGSRRLTRRLRLPTPALQLLHLRTLPAFPDGFFISTIGLQQELIHLSINTGEAQFDDITTEHTPCTSGHRYKG